MEDSREENGLVDQSVPSADKILEEMVKLSQATTRASNETFKTVAECKRLIQNEQQLGVQRTALVALRKGFVTSSVKLTRDLHAMSVLVVYKSHQKKLLEDEYLVLLGEMCQAAKSQDDGRKMEDDRVGGEQMTGNCKAADAREDLLRMKAKIELIDQDIAGYKSLMNRFGELRADHERQVKLYTRRIDEVKEEAQHNKAATKKQQLILVEYRKVILELRELSFFPL